MPKLYTVEKLSLGYNAITTLTILIFLHTIEKYSSMLIARAIIASIIFILAYSYAKYPAEWLRFIRYFFHVTALAFWYPDTFNFNRYLPNLDYLFAGIDQRLFHCQPSIQFSELLPQKWFNELMNLGYYSYYPMIVGTVIIFYFSRKAYFDKALTMIVGSFFIFYSIFLITPVAGPQYYFPAIHYSIPTNGNFPHLHTYFNTHEDLAEMPIGDAYFFRELVKSNQEKGEEPTGAFPSSHVGISSILMLMLFCYCRKKWVYLFLPFYVLLIGATVYIKAHYLIDVLGGFIAAYLIFSFFQRSFACLSSKHSQQASVEPCSK